MLANWSEHNRHLRGLGLRPSFLLLEFSPSFFPFCLPGVCPSGRELSRILSRTFDRLSVATDDTKGDDDGAGDAEPAAPSLVATLATVTAMVVCGQPII